MIDCFATDHAPHTVEEKHGDRVPPGFPGLETAVPLLLRAVDDGLMEVSDLVARLADNPRRIFGLTDQPDTHVEVALEPTTISAAASRSRAGWTPFEGWEVPGRIERVELRGTTVLAGGDVLAPPGFGINVRSRED